MSYHARFFELLSVVIGHLWGPLVPVLADIVTQMPAAWIIQAFVMLCFPTHATYTVGFLYSIRDWDPTMSA